MDFLSLASSRYSVREFSDRAVGRDTLAYILEAGRRVPSACNRQPQRVYVVESREGREKLASVCRFTFGAPLILVIGYDTEREWKNKLDGGHGSGEVDSTIVMTQMMLAAWERGIGSCIVGYFCPDAVKQVLSLPETTVVTAMLPMGYPKEDAVPFYMHDECRELADTVTFL